MANPAKKPEPVYMVNGSGRVVRVPRVGDGYPIPEGWRPHSKPAAKPAPDTKPAGVPAKEH
jgi:hypothetical protein